VLGVSVWALSGPPTGRKFIAAIPATVGGVVIVASVALGRSESSFIGILWLACAWGLYIRERVLLGIPPILGRM
jgi:hypothetical protein